MVVTTVLCTTQLERTKKAWETIKMIFVALMHVKNLQSRHMRYPQHVSDVISEKMGSLSGGI